MGPLTAKFISGPESDFEIFKNSASYAVMPSEEFFKTVLMVCLSVGRSLSRPINTKWEIIKSH